MSLFWDLLYLFKKTPWDTGVTPPEIASVIESGKVPIGRALDLGCGTGTNAIYLAQHGFAVIGIDVSRRAIALAKRKVRSAQLGDRVRLERDDVTLMRRYAVSHSTEQSPFSGGIDFAYDIGCFHNLKPEARQRYVAALTAVLKPGAIYMLYAFEPQVDRVGVALDEIAALFDAAYRLDGMRRGEERHGRGSAWYTLIKRVPGS
ncbi:cobalt-precorrin-6B (C15)-methyltransferase [Thermoflexales bacterium]|nr:cobalt-precorrin-6B (C15)-methyltransferase [Thermoflexales bacterium]